MTSTDLDQIEQALGLRLPTDYRATMQAYPLPLDPDGASMWLVADADRVIALNRMRRETRIGQQPWPSHLFAIGHDGGEQTFVLDLSATPASVAAYSIETGALSPLSRPPEVAPERNQILRSRALRARSG